MKASSQRPLLCLNVFPYCCRRCGSAAKIFRLLWQTLSKFLAAGWGGLIEEVLPETMSALGSYDWPGNIRELQNLIELPVILSTMACYPILCRQ